MSSRSFQTFGHNNHNHAATWRVQALANISRSTTTHLHCIHTRAYVCCHSNETDKQIWKLFQDEKLEGTPKHFWKLHWNACNSAGMHRWTDTQTDTHTDRQTPMTTILFALSCPTRNVTDNQSTTQLQRQQYRQCPVQQQRAQNRPTCQHQSIDTLCASATESLRRQ